MAPININGNSIDPNKAPSNFFPPDASKSDFILVQGHDDLTFDVRFASLPLLAG